MAAKPLTTEEKNYLKSVYLTFIIGTDAVRTHFDFLHPPANLVTHLANDKSKLEWLKEDGIISREEWEKLFPRSGARATCTSAEFDITTLICLLREMTPKVTAPRHTTKKCSFDLLPDIHVADKSTGACLAIIKWYRNFLAHPDQVKLKTLSSETFNDLFTQVEMAIKVLGNNQYCSKVVEARQLNIDNDFAEILEKFVTHEKQLEDLHGSVQQIRKQTNHLQTSCDKCGDKSDELENEMRTLETSLQHVQELEKDISDIKSKLKLDREAIEKKVIDLSKQLAEFKTQTNATLALHSKNITELSEQQQDYHSLTEGLEKTAKQVDQLKSKEEVHGKEIKDLQENEQSQKEGLENTAKQLDECKRETNKIGEIQIQHLERFENLEKKTESLKSKEEVHGKEMKDLQANQRGIFSKIVRRREIDEIKLPESFEKIKEVTHGAKALRKNDILILVGIKGSGKSTIGKAIIKQYCEGNPDYDIIQLSTTKESEMNYSDVLGFFRSSNQVVVFLDDLFGRVPSTYAYKEHLMLLKWVYEKHDGIKILCTVQAETKACVEELFLSDRGDALLISAEIINLHSAIYPRRDMLIKSGFDEESSDNIIQQIKETDVLEKIGFPALVSIYKENQELGDELFTNPGNVLMKYLSSLKEGSEQDKMYFVILIHVLMIGKVYKKQNTIDGETTMCHIATTLFGNTLKYQKCDSSIENIIDEKEDGILMNKYDLSLPYYCFKNEIIRDFIFQNYKAEGIEKNLTTCSLNCIVSYFRPYTDTGDEPLVCIKSTLYQSIASHIINIIEKNLKASRMSDVCMSVKTLCMSPLLQDENFLNALMIECDRLSITIYGQTFNVTQSYDRIGSIIKVFHFPSILLYQSCRQLSMMHRENVKVVKTIFRKLCHTGEKEDSLHTDFEKEEICQAINTLVRFSMEELCKENIDEHEVLEMLWKFIMDKEVDCQYNQFLMNAWRNQCPKTVIWLQENIREPNWLQIEQCFLDICCFGGVHKASWIFVQNPKSEQIKISMYKVFNEALKRFKRDRELLDNIWKLEERILEDYKQDEKLHANTSTENAKINIANMVMKIALEVHSTSTLFRWACDTFKPHTQYFDKTMRKKIEREKTEKQDVNSLFFK